MSRKTAISLGYLIGISTFLISGVATAQVSGAIHTTTPFGEIVNENVHYASKADVFLSGGPGPNAPSKAAGLPPGEYYFQVTDPSGKKLLSEDSARDRCVVVGSGGYIINERCAVYGPGTHLLNPKTGTANEFVVQLIPYLDTPNNGGVYKAWMTPADKYVGDPDAIGNQNCGNGCFHGFIPADSKMDNFKTRDVQTYCITAWKFIVDKKTGTQPTAGWPIVFRGNVEHTGDEGFVKVCGLTPDSYEISELLPADYNVVATEVNGVSLAPTTTVTVTVGKGTPGDREPIVVWTNESVTDQPCNTKDCYYK